MPRPLPILLLTVFALAAADSAAAQACIGLPSRDGQIAATAALTLAEDYNALGGEFTVDATGPMSFGFGYSRDTGMDELVGGGERHVTTFDARAAYELFLVDPSICAVAGLWYQDAAVEQFGVPVGFGFGKTLPGRALSTTLYAIPQYVWLRETPGGDLDDRTSNEFMARAGVTFGLQQLLFGGDVTVTTFGADNPRFALRAGFIF